MQSQRLAEDKAHLEASTVSAPTSPSCHMIVLNAFDQKKFQQRLADQMKRQREQQATPTPDIEQLVRARVAELTVQQARDHETAVQAAVSKATESLRAELQSSTTTVQPNADLTAVIVRHEEELKALEGRLTEKHAAEMKAAVESALATVPKPEGAAEAAHDVEALVKERLEVSLKEQDQKVADAIKIATENGRKEVNTKLMIKDGQLMKAVTAKKELEQKVKELEARLASSSTSSTNVPQSSVASPTVTSIKAPSNVNANADIPRKAQSAATTSAPAGATQPVRGTRGRGRGVAIRGGAAVATAQAAGHGGVLAQVNSAAAASSSGTSILGAASGSTATKRPRNDTDTPAESPSLAKRLRGPPVTLQRNRHLPSSET